jgi:hypothetical protein
MQKSHFPWILCGILLFGWILGHGLGLVLAALGLFVSYFISLRLNPRMTHWRCKGRGWYPGAVFTWTRHRCQSPHCDGGRIIRWGARHLGKGHIRNEHARNVSIRQAARSRGEWR